MIKNPQVREILEKAISLADSVSKLTPNKADDLAVAVAKLLLGKNLSDAEVSLVIEGLINILPRNGVGNILIWVLTSAVTVLNQSNQPNQQNQSNK